MAAWAALAAACVVATIAASHAFAPSPLAAGPRPSPLLLTSSSPPSSSLRFSSVAAVAATRGEGPERGCFSSAFSSSWTSSLVGCCLLVAAAGATGRGRGRIAMSWGKRYGGGPVKKDPAAEFGPQYWGPTLDYAIQRRPRLGTPVGGQRRVIPKLSGGSYERRKAIMRGLTESLIRHGRIKTTLGRANALGSFVDRMIVLAKRGDDLARREAGEWMYDEKLVDNLFKQAPERYYDQTKGFTQVTRTMNRSGDWAEMAYIELI